MQSPQSFICVMAKWLSTADPEVHFGIAVLDCKMAHGIVRLPAKPVLNTQYEWLAIFTMKPDFAKDWGLHKSHPRLQKLHTPLSTQCGKTWMWE
ncbi:hypothetical protein [Polynucleobacter sp. Latsch14-2]|jgi:hypothetical protein|uniref:hypothetical protein n=1 Tax=Polynucleobacter sp. Latsch14-2 TaxID=2576920 RepID=UPI001C20EF70|nr:hypothetical protein [Polynucleobacter sp. Latsch14-2]